MRSGKALTPFLFPCADSFQIKTSLFAGFFFFAAELLQSWKKMSPTSSLVMRQEVVCARTSLSMHQLYAFAATNDISNGLPTLVT